jgi:hypothetical protein
MTVYNLVYSVQYNYLLNAHTVMEASVAMLDTEKRNSKCLKFHALLIVFRTISWNIYFPF